MTRSWYSVLMEEKISFINSHSKIHIYYTCVHAQTIQSCLTLCDPTVAHQTPLSMGLSRQEYWRDSMPSSRGSSQLKDIIHVSCGSFAGGFFTVSHRIHTTVNEHKNISCIISYLRKYKPKPQ